MPIEYEPLSKTERIRKRVSDRKTKNNGKIRNTKQVLEDYEFAIGYPRLYDVALCNECGFRELRVLDYGLCPMCDTPLREADLPIISEDPWSMTCWNASNPSEANPPLWNNEPEVLFHVAKPDPFYEQTSAAYRKDAATNSSYGSLHSSVRRTNEGKTRTDRYGETWSMRLGTR